MRIPILGRLTWHDYKRLTLTIFILILEGFLRFTTWLVPVSVLDFVRFRVLRLFPRLFRGYHDEDIKEYKDPIRDAVTTPQLIEFHGYRYEEHVVLTGDGYFLALHRILPAANVDTVSNETNGLPSPQVSATSSRTRRSGMPILLIHGAMMSSEIWVCHRTARKNLVFHLVDEGYDIWLANRRGCKYSQKHVIYKPYESRFWDFSMDETILHDVPAQVEYILGATGSKSLSLIGFSQGTAEIFGALSICRKLQRRVNCVVAFSATAKPPTPSNTLIKSMVHWTPELVFLLFGRKSMMSSVYFWQSVLSPPAMSWLMDWTMNLLFGWRNFNIKWKDKPMLYRHLYSTASVKQIAHWFQIMRASRFQMYDDSNSSNRARIIPEFPLRNNEVAKLVIFGMKDCLVNPDALLAELRNATMIEMKDYEHMDPIWAHDACTKVFPQVIEFIKKNSSYISRKGFNDSDTFTWPPALR